MTDQLNRLKTALADRYTVERELGSGGMATVYLAQDLKHRRKVAIKVLRPELSATLGPERFVREIEIAAKLNHPHILALFDSGEADGFLYYVMPFVEGESLRDRLAREEKLSVSDAVRITDQVASALSYAHERGVVHRDIKPENILCTGDQAIVADFGIARAVEVAGGEKLTGTGIAVGTPAYMSPEQAVGDTNVDARSDVYALGCVVYEMVSGRAPFEGETPQAMLAKHAVGTTPSLRTSDPSIPLFLDRAVERALAKQPADRFQTASDFAEALTCEMVVARVGRRRWPWLAISGTIVLLAAAALILLNVLGGPAYERLAVLPPTNLMNDPEQEYFVQGVHTALISELQRAGVPVIARTSVMRYENTQMLAREIAQELGVDALIEAAVMRAGDSVEIEVSLVDGNTQEYVADPIVRRSTLRDVERLYRGLTAAIAAEIRTALTPQAEARLASAREVDPQAYEAYLKGTYYAAKLTAPELETALEFFELARDIDPEYALAYEGIASAWVIRQQMSIAPPSETAPRMRAALARALELDSTLVEVQALVAGVKMYTDWDWEGAEVAFRRAIELNPNLSGVRANYALLLCIVLRFDEAILQAERAIELDPLNPIVHNHYAVVLYLARRYDDAIAQFQNLLQMAPNYPVALGNVSSVYEAKGMYDEAVAAGLSFYTVIGFTEAEEALASFYAEGDYRRAMHRMADTLVALRSVTYVKPMDIAGCYFSAGQNSQALDWMERAFEEHDAVMPWLRAFPLFYDALRDEPRYQDLLRRMNLPP